VKDFTQRNGGEDFSTSQPSRAFGCDAGWVKAALEKALNEPKARGRDFAFDDQSEIQILEWIRSQADKCAPATRTDLRRHCKVKYSHSISRGWVYSFILRQKANLSETKSTSQDDVRLEVPRVFLDETVNYVREHVHGIKMELDFNLGEVGMSEWEDDQVRKIIVPTTMNGKTIHHHTSRSVQHISIITSISTAGECMTPDIVTSQDSDAIRKRLMIHDVRRRFDFVLRHRPKPYVSRKLFSSIWIRSSLHT
jgi:hypothetical protein